MAKTATINSDELEGLRELAQNANTWKAQLEERTAQYNDAQVTSANNAQRATDAEAGERRAREQAQGWHQKWEAAMKTAQQESAARVRAERERFDSLRGMALRSLLWLDDNVGEAINKHPAFLHLARVVPEIMEREFRKDVAVSSDIGVMAAENGLLISFAGDVVFDLVLPWETVDELSTLEGRPVAEDSEEHLRYKHEIERYRDLLTGMLRELIG